MNSFFSQYFPTHNPEERFSSSSVQAAGVANHQAHIEDDIGDGQRDFHAHGRPHAHAPLNEDVATPFAPNTPPNATISIPLSKEAESLVASGLSQMSLQERERVTHCVHGVEELLQEDANLVYQSLEQLNNELDQYMQSEQARQQEQQQQQAYGTCTNSEPPALYLALQHSPSYVRSQKFQLKFLRADLFNASASLNRMKSFFKIKLQLFGFESLGRDITIAQDFDENESNDDWEALQSGYTQLLPGRDRAGRPIIFYLTNKRMGMSTRSIAKYWFYLTMVAVEDVSTQQRGVCLIKYDIRNNQDNLPLQKANKSINTAPDATTSTSIFDSFHFRQQQQIRREQKQLEEQQISNNESAGDVDYSATADAATDNTTARASNDREFYGKMANFHESFPIRLVAFHVCYIDPSMIQRNWLSVVVKKFARNDRAKFRFHHGPHMECQYELMTYGIPQQVLPVNFNGEIDLSKHHEWIRQRQNQEAEQLLSMMSASMAMMNNKNSDQRQQYDGQGDETQMNEGTRQPSPLSATPVPSSSLDLNDSLGDIAEDEPEVCDIHKPTAISETTNDSTISGTTEGKKKPRNGKPSGKKQSRQKSNKRLCSPNPPDSSSPIAVAVPDHEDVLMGRGNLNHYGNLKFRQIIDEHQHEYEQADKNGKTNVALKIVHMVKKNGGRFLKKDKNLGWIEETDEAARYRVSHRFRNMRGPGPGSGSGNSGSSPGANAFSGSGTSSKRKNPAISDTASMLSELSPISSEGIPITESRHSPAAVSSVTDDNTTTTTASTVSGSKTGGNSIFGIQLPSFSQNEHAKTQQVLFLSIEERDSDNNSKRPRGQQQYQPSEDSWADNNNNDSCFFFKPHQTFGSRLNNNHQNMIG